MRDRRNGNRYRVASRALGGDNDGAGADQTLLDALSNNPEDRLDLGCVAAHGMDLRRWGARRVEEGR